MTFLVPWAADSFLTALASGALVAWQYAESGHLSFEAAATSVGLVMCLLVWGRIVVDGFSLHRAIDPTWALQLLAGMAVACPALAVARLTLPFSIRWLFLGLFGAGIGISSLRARSIQSWLRAGGLDRAEIAAVVLCVASAGGLVRHYFPPILDDPPDVVFEPIRDHFIHAHQVILLANDAGPKELGRYGLAGEPVPFYHYASYVPPAIVTAFTGERAYDAATAVWMPMGLLFLGLSAYVLGRACFGPAAGVWCAVALLAIPDPTYWTLGLAPAGFYYYAFHRFLQYAMANAYGIACAGLGLAMVLAGLRAGRLGPIVVGVAAAAISLLFKAQVFVAAFPICVATPVLWELRPEGRLRARLSGRRLILWSAGAFLAAGASAVVLLPLLAERLPRIALEVPPAQRLSEFLLTKTIDDPVAFPLARAAATTEGMGGVLLRAVLVLFVPFRWALLLLAVVLAARVRAEGRFGPFDLACLLALAVYLGYSLLLAPNLTPYAFGNPWDLQHVPFAWLYFLLAVWLVGSIAQVAAAWLPRVPAPPLALAVWTAVIPILVGGRDFRDGLTPVEWAYLRQPAGVVKIADQVRKIAAPGERIQDSEDDPYYVVEALAERRAYVGWPVVGSYTAKTTADDVFRARLAEHAELRRATTIDRIRDFARRTGVRYYIHHPKTELAWPKEILDRPAAEREGIKLYDLADLPLGEERALPEGPQ